MNYDERSPVKKSNQDKTDFQICNKHDCKASKTNKQKTNIHTDKLTNKKQQSKMKALFNYGSIFSHAALHISF